MIDDGMSPTMRELLYRLKIDEDRALARVRALAARPAPPDGHQYLDVGATQLATRLQIDAQAAAEVRSDVESAIRAGELRATSARKKLQVRPGTKFDPDDCLVKVDALFAWAGVDTARSVNTPADPGGASPESSPTQSTSEERGGDAMTSPISRFANLVGPPWPTADVWAKLFRWAGTDGRPSPVVDTRAGVITYMHHESNRQLTYERFESRMSRWRTKQRKLAQGGAE